VVHTPELQAYTASKLYNAIRADISQDALTQSATWILGEYSEVLIEGGLVDEEQTSSVWVDENPFDCF
jgi:AP-1 complex subunit gamma-1